MRTCIFTDPHINESSIDELKDIFREIASESDSKTILVCVGDWLDHKRPTPREVTFSAKWGRRFRAMFHSFVIVQGNHPTISNETSAIDYLQYLNVIIRDRLELDDMYFGHHFHDNSWSKYDEEVPEVDYSKYRFSFLGHEHTWQDLGKNIYHLGSVRYCTFREGHIPNKKYAIVKDHKLEWKEVKSLIPMRIVSDINELDGIDPKTKVRLDFTSLKKFKQDINNISKYKKKFYQFKVKLDFKTKINTVVKTASNFDELFQGWVSSIEDREVKNLLVDVFKQSRTT